MTSVCTERIFDSRMLLYNKIFLKKLSKKFIVLIFTLLLAPFAPKFVNYSRHSESLKYVWKSTKRCYRSPQIIDQFCTQRVPKEAWRCGVQTSLTVFFKNILLCMKGWLLKNRSVHTYVKPRTVYFDWICNTIKSE